MVYDSFFTLFCFEKEEYEVPGRDIDDEGNVCSWYLEEDWPYISNNIVLELICILNEQVAQVHFKSVKKIDLVQEVLQKITDYGKFLKDTNQEEKLEELTTQIHELFEEDWNDREEED